MLSGAIASKPAPIRPPSIAPTNSAGANSPPDDPPPIVSDVATTFRTSSSASVPTVMLPSAASSMTPKPMPKISSCQKPIAPTASIASAGRPSAGMRIRAIRSSAR